MKLAKTPRVILDYAMETFRDLKKKSFRPYEIPNYNLDLRSYGKLLPLFFMLYFSFGK